VPEGIRVKIKALSAVVFLAVLAILYFRSALTGEMLLTERDLSIFFIPPRLFWVDAIQAGEFPLWNPYSFAGHPLFATLQPGILYPLNLLLFVLPFDLAFNWTIITHSILAGAFTFLLLREYHTSIAGSVSGALVFMLSGYLFSVHNVMSTLFTVAWAPLAIFFFTRALKRGSYLYSVLTGMTLAVMFLGGGIEVLFGVVLILLAASLYPRLLLFSGKGGIKSNLLIFMLSIAVFIGLSAIQLIPFLELASQSTRAGGLTYLEATTWSFDLKDFIQFFIPDPYGYFSSTEKYWANQSWLKTVYLGTIPFILSIFFFQQRKRQALPFAFLSVIFLMLAMGRNTAIYHFLFDNVPFIDKIRYPVKFLFAPFLFIALAAGLGFDALKDGLSKKDGKALKTVMVILAASTLAALAFGFLSFFDSGVREHLTARGIDFPEYNKADINIFNAKRVLLFYMMAAVAIYAASKTARPAKLLAFIIPALLASDLFFAHNGYYEATPAKEYHAKGESLDFLSKDDAGLFRVFISPKTAKDLSFSLKDSKAPTIDRYKELVSGFNLNHGVFDSGGVEVMKRADYWLVYDLASSQAAPDATNIISMLNVKYVISAPVIDSKEFRLVKTIGKDEGGLKALKIYENPGFTPRFYMAYDYRVIEKPREMIDRLVDKKFAPGSTVLLEEEPWKTERPVLSKAPSSIDITGYRNNSVELKVRTETDGVLVAGESWYPGWKAYVDGREERVLKADLIFRAVPIKAGEHVVRFVYEPLSFVIGLWISSASVLILALFFLLRARKSRAAEA